LNKCLFGGLKISGKLLKCKLRKELVKNSTKMLNAKKNLRKKYYFELFSKSFENLLTLC